MKRVLFLFTLFASFVTTSVNAQGRTNIDKQPVWGPTGYDQVDYYYIPEADAYYNVSRQKYVYLQANKWVFRNSLPARHKNLDLYKTYKIVINGDKPYRQHKEHQTKYASYKNRRDQPVIKDSREEKYFINKKHPGHKTWKKNKQK